MKRLKITLFFIVLVGLIAFGLWNNKAQSAAKQKTAAIVAFPVSVEIAQKQKLDRLTSVTGTIVGNNDVAIVSETQGRVTGIYAKVGDQLGSGTVLIQIDDELKKSNFVLAEANYIKTKKDLERNEELYKNKAISESQIESSRLGYQSAEALYIIARRQLSDTRITTPISGIVTARYVDVGTMVSNNTVVANVVDISRLKVKVNVAEKDVFQMKVGDKATVSTDVYPGIFFAAKIENISAKGDEAHTYPVELSLTNDPKNPLKAGMFARIEFQNMNDVPSIVIAREAVITSVKKPQVYVVENDKVKLRDVVIGSSSSSKVEILGGLKEGEIVVVSGLNTLSEDAPVTIVKQ